MTLPCPAPADETEAAILRRLGIDTGRWVLQGLPLSSTPLLTYARELQALQQRFGTVLTDQQRWPLPRDREEHAETEALHVHDDAELRVVLAGRARYVVADAGVPRLIDLGPGEWLRIPAGLPHRLLPLPGARLDLLRLFSQRGGWVAHAVDPALERSAA